MRGAADPGVRQVRAAIVPDDEVLPRVCAPDGAICRAASGSATVYEKAVDKIVKSKEFVDFMNDGPFTILYKESADFSKFLDSASGSLSGPHISVVSPRSVSASALPS
jgi:hypothetical protein